MLLHSTSPTLRSSPRWPSTVARCPVPPRWCLRWPLCCPQACAGGPGTSSLPPTGVAPAGGSAPSTQCTPHCKLCRGEGGRPKASSLALLPSSWPLRSKQVALLSPPALPAPAACPPCRGVGRVQPSRACPEAATEGQGASVDADVAAEEERMRELLRSRAGARASLLAGSSAAAGAGSAEAQAACVRGKRSAMYRSSCSRLIVVLVPSRAQRAGAARQRRQMLSMHWRFLGCKESTSPACSVGKYHYFNHSALQAG